LFKGGQCFLVASEPAQSLALTSIGLDIGGVQADGLFVSGYRLPVASEPTQSFAFALVGRDEV